MISRTFAEMQAAFGEQMHSEIKALEAKVSDVAIDQLQLVTQARFVCFDLLALLASSCQS